MSRIVTAEQVVVSDLLMSHDKPTDLVGKEISHARDTNGQQIPEASPDVTSLVFPAIGAILILVFGGFLLSSGNSCCHVASSNKKKNGQENEGIEFAFMGNSFFPKSFPVLQQENNDVVEAVMETYSDLPQYAPISELMASIPGILPEQAIVAKKPETRDACVSPIHGIDHVGTSPGNDADVQTRDACVSHVGTSPGNDADVQTRDACVSHVGTYPGNDADVQIAIEEDDSPMQSIPNMEKDYVIEVEDCSRLNESSGIGTCSRVNTPAVMSSLSFDENDNVAEHCRELQRNLKSSCDKEKSRDWPTLVGALPDVKQTSNTTFTRSTVEKWINDAKVSCDKEKSRDWPTLVGALPDVKQTSNTTITRSTVEKWINDAKASCDAVQADSTLPFQWKRPVKLTNEHKLEILKILQPNFDANNDKADNVNKVVANSASQSERVNIPPYSSTMQSACDNKKTADTSPTRNVGGYIINNKGGRLSRLKVVRAPSAMCIHGNLCSGNCKSSHVTIGRDDFNRDDSGRGASCLGMSFRESVATPRGASAFVEDTRGASAFVEDTRGASAFVEDTRGASAFVDTSPEHSVLFSKPDSDIRDNNTQHRDKARRHSRHSMDSRGASAYSDCLSVTLSMAVQSEKEDNSLTGFVLKQLEMKEELVETTKPNEFSLHKDDKLSSQATDDRVKRPQVTAVRSDALIDKTLTSLPYQQPLANIETMTTNTRDVIPNDKRTLDFKPHRCSTPNHGDAIASTKATEKVKCDVITHDERLGEISCDRSSIHESRDMRTENPQKSLGKNTRALSGLLKALQREKHKKDSMMKNDGGGLVLIPDGQTAEDTRPQSTESVTESVTLERRKHVVGKLKVCLFYNNGKSTKPVLYVTVLKASSLRKHFIQPNEDLYVRMHVSTRDDKTEQTKSVSTSTNTAVFNHLFQVHDITMRELEVSVMKLVLVSGHSNQEEAIANVPLADLVSRDKIKKTYLLKGYFTKPNQVSSMGQGDASFGRGVFSGEGYLADLVSRDKIKKTYLLKGYFTKPNQ
ncbi:hypothetical protein QZH41_011102, partial [Actinostola sp. cb2023]